MKIKGNQVYTLLKTFSVVLILIMTLFTLIISYTIFKRNIEKAEQSLNFVSEKMTSLTKENWEYVQQKALDLTDNPQKIETMLSYFELPYANYLEQSLNEASSAVDFQYLPNEIYHLYWEGQGLVSVSLALDNFEKAFSSSIHGNMYGQKVDNILPSDGIRFSTVLKAPYTAEGFGTTHMDFEKSRYDDVLQSANFQLPMQVFLLSDTNQLLYHNARGKVDKALEKEVKDQLSKKFGVDQSTFKQQYLFQEAKTNNNYKILAFVPKQAILTNTLKQSSGLFLFSFFVDILLLVVLFVLFRKYVYQVEDILASSMAVSKGDYQNRISLKDKKGEMKQIAQGINQMLDSMQLYLKDIYDLEIKQRDAQMGALQAQINPHFLYNTLEYIRMSAISEGAEELGEVVYAFGALLRNNISQEKMVSLESEMDFCEKYIYLYQMRYPSQIAYHFDIADETKQLNIPKFTIQPLIENYFTHGVDFTKIENVISVKAYIENDLTVIKIIDNGLGMSEEEIEKLNQTIIEKKEPSKKSVGVLNVNQRLCLTFGNQATMKYSSTTSSGITITIKILMGGEEDVSSFAG